MAGFRSTLSMSKIKVKILKQSFAPFTRPWWCFFHTVLELKHIQIKNGLISTRKLRGKPSIFGKSQIFLVHMDHKKAPKKPPPYGRFKLYIKGYKLHILIFHVHSTSIIYTYLLSRKESWKRIWRRIQR